MSISEPFEIAMMVLKRPFDTFTKFKEKRPGRQMVFLCLVVWLAISSYIFSYLGLEFYHNKISHFIIYSTTTLLSIIFFFMLFSLTLYFNAVLLFGRGSLNTLFTCLFYSFLSLIVYMALPLQLVAFTVIPPEYEYWFTVLTRPAIVFYFAFLAIAAVSKSFNLTITRSAIAFFAIFAYVAFFIFSVIYISRKYNIPLY